MANICPGVHGMFIVKLAVALTLIGGVPHVDPVNGTRTRGECHMLMVGEPGTGKSQFLRYPVLSSKIFLFFSFLLLLLVQTGELLKRTSKKIS